jgi:NitT/TauT family transport system ATP-binding protein
MAHGSWIGGGGSPDGGSLPTSSPAMRDVAGRPSVGAGPAPSPVVVSGVSVSFRQEHGGRLHALEHVDLQVRPREVVAIIGPNGSGKSTLLRVIGGLLAPTSGTVTIDGRPVTGPDPAIGFVFQEPRLLPWRDTLENVALPLELSGIPSAERRRRASELLHLVGLDRFAGYRPHQLSGGMRQRTAIARALALGPSILLLDEPFSALDALTRERFNIELLKLWERTATTIVLVTHSIREAIFLADRVLVLSPRPGHVIAEVRSPLPRPRSAADLDDPRIADVAIEIRRHLGFSGEEGGRPSELTTDAEVHDPPEALTDDAPSGAAQLADGDAPGERQPSDPERAGVEDRGSLP